jgi:NAD(P)-dependent dehydrogenase (short-subunit alcohol dehydrogenase family)
MTYLVTGGTSFIGRHLLRRLAARDGAVRVLVRASSVAKLRRLGIDGVEPVVGDVTLPGLGMAPEDAARLRGAELFHLAAVYDLEASEEDAVRANVDGTRHVLAFAHEIGAARLHHVSSIAVAGARFRGEFTEDMFDQGQDLGHPYYRTKFEAERLVREQRDVPWRVYRPGLVIGSSQTGEADRVDGPYYGFKIIQRLRTAFPPWMPLVGFEGGRLNMVPVDFVAAAIDHIAARPGLDGQTFHVVDPTPHSFGDATNEFCRAAHAPQFSLRVDRRAFGVVPEGLRGMLGSWRVLQALRSQLLEGARIPPAALDYLGNRARFGSARAQEALEGSGIQCPPLHSYAWRVWDYWERHLDPEAPTEANFAAALSGRVMVVTGASSGIGRAVACRVARHGAIVVLVARSRDKLDALREEIATAGGTAHVHAADLSDMDACARVAEQVLAAHGRVDVLLNNAGRSIRRSLVASLDRFHDFERTMRLNYFGALKLMLAFVPGMRERRSGHIINVSSIGVQSYPPRFGAYVASKSALASLSRCIGPELADDGIAVTTIHMPLVRTPMIEPTGMYRNFPTIDTEQATDMVMQAILSRPPEVSTRLGKLGEAVDTLSPALHSFIMTGAYHAFPDSAGEPAPEDTDGAISPEAAALAYLMRGIHF